MTTTLSSESANWILPSYPRTFTSTLPNYEEAPPFRVNHEGVKNYVKNRGSLNIGDWAIEGRRMSTTATILSDNQQSNLVQPKVLGSEALRNYNKSRCSTPNLIYGDVQPPDSHHGMRVKREGQANYNKNHDSQVKTLQENYGKLPLPRQPAPHIQGEVATNLYYLHQEGQMGPILNNYGRSSATPRSVPPHVKGLAAQMNREKGRGDSQLLEHGIKRHVPISELNLKGEQAHLNYDMGQGHHVNELFHRYGKLQQSARTAPKVKFDGVDNFAKGQGDSMRKTLSQCPPTNRRMERPQTAPFWQ
ncbi:unnamed protein product [Adineta steineri]|uniref:Uncharacterized protein n=1 Tax=Adineta steineri TaxID=433720 RepID=A0A815F0R4_9BILA|nr:unnamed protein product [Adineta steineri]CAF1401526.1 unnamed protein product [Adineta steineri]